MIAADILKEHCNWRTSARDSSSGAGARRQGTLTLSLLSSSTAPVLRLLTISQTLVKQSQPASAQVFRRRTLCLLLCRLPHRRKRVSRRSGCSWCPLRFVRSRGRGCRRPGFFLLRSGWWTTCLVLVVLRKWCVRRCRGWLCPGPGWCRCEERLDEADHESGYPEAKTTTIPL